MLVYGYYDNGGRCLKVNSFEKLLELDNYNDIKFISCISNDLSIIPILPTGLTNFNCSYNNIMVLPVLPNSLINIDCSNNRIHKLPVLPKCLESLTCWWNQLTTLPVLPDSLESLYCSINKLTLLPMLPTGIIDVDCRFNLLTFLPYGLRNINVNYDNNPIYTYINEKCNGSEEIYYNEVKVFSNKIASWFLECKYNPNYKYCRDRVNREYDELYVLNIHGGKVMKKI